MAKKRTGRPRTKFPSMDEVKRLSDLGCGLKQIAKKLGFSYQLIWVRMKEAGIPRRPQHSCPGERNPAWKGGSYIDNDGYVLIYAPDHPYATKEGRVREHRLVMEKIIGRYLLPNEVVHHKDDDRQNNGPDNLELFSDNGEHLKKTLKGKCPKWSPEGWEIIQRNIKKMNENNAKRKRNRA